MTFSELCPVKRVSTKLACLSAALCLTLPAWANLVQNPGFETGDFTDWTVGTSNNGWQVDVSGDHGDVPFDGTFFASDGCVGPDCISGPQQSSLSQNLLTTSGQNYDLTFWFYTGGNSTPNELDVLWNGASVLDLGPGGTLGVIDSYTEFTVTGLNATSSSSTLTFLDRQDPGWIGLDDIDVEPAGTSAVPEPSAIPFAMAGLFGILLMAPRYVKKPE